MCMSSFLVEVYGSVKDYIILDSLLEHLQDNAKQDEQQYVFWFLIANKFYESVKFYAVNDFCHVTELDDRANQYVKYYLMDWLNEYSQTPRPLTADQRKEMEDYIESFNEIIDICVSAEELKQLPFLEGKIDYDELITDYSNVIFHEKPNESYSIQQLKIILCKERADYHQLSQEKAQLQAKIAALSAQLANNGQQDKPVLLTNTYTTPELVALNDVINEFWIDFTPDKVPPKQQTIINWVKQKYDFTDARAKAIDQIARHPDTKKGGNKAL